MKKDKKEKEVIKDKKEKEVIVDAAADKEKKLITAKVRSRIYHLLSQAYLYPNEVSYTLIKNGFVEELRNSFSYLLLNYTKDDAKIEEILDNLESLDKAIKRLTEGPLTDFQGHFARVFGHTISQECPQYETQFGIKAEDVFHKCHELGDIAGFYNAFGLDITDAQTLKERVDHISVEFEFMYFLANKEAYGIENKDAEDKLDIVTSAQKKFVREHIAMWVPVFAKYLAKKTKTGFYKEISDLTKAFVEQEIAYLKVKPRRLKSEEVSVEPPEDELITCDTTATYAGGGMGKPNPGGMGKPH